MSENGDDVLSKQQAILDSFFNLLGIFAFDRAKDFLEKERDIAIKNHTVAPFFSSVLSAFIQLATAEKNYANFIFLGPKGFLRKDSTLKSMYESLKTELQRLEDKHYITPVSTPTMSPTSSCRTPSPSIGLPSPSPSISVCSEASGSVLSSLSIGSSVWGSMVHTINWYQGEEMLENLASHLCGQLLSFVSARLEIMDLYEKMCAMSSSKFVKYGLLLNRISEIVKTNSKLFHHPLLTSLKSSFSFECETLLKLLEAEVHMEHWRFLPSLLCLHDAHSKLGSWLSKTKEIKKISSNYRAPQIPPLYNWLCSLKSALVAKFSLYFHEILSKQTTIQEMKNFCSKSSVDYFMRIVTFQKRYDAACIAIVLDTNGLDDFRGHGYNYPWKLYETPKGLDSFPPIVCYPPNCFSQEKHASHWPSVVMIMTNREQEIRNTDTAVLFYDPRANATYFMAKVECRMTLVIIFESKKTDRDAHIHRFMCSLCTQLRCNKVFSSLKPGSK